ARLRAHGEPAAVHAHERCRREPRDPRGAARASPPLRSMSTFAQVGKRGVDLLLAGGGLVLLSPVLAAIALAVKLDSPWPVFFRQERVGRHGVHFRIHKFRTMHADASRRGPEITVGRDARI